MSYRSDALDAFDAMDRDEFMWFRPRRSKRLSRDEFRDLITEGRVDARLVLHNVLVAQRLAALMQKTQEVIGEQVDMPIRRKGTGHVAVLEVIT